MSPTISFSQDSIDAAILRSHVFTMSLHIYISIFFFFNDTATTEIYTLSLHDALPIYEFVELGLADLGEAHQHRRVAVEIDRKSTRLNSSHGYISYAVFCLKKKNIHSLNRI